MEDNNVLFGSGGGSFREPPKNPLMRLFRSLSGVRLGRGTGKFGRTLEKSTSANRGIRRNLYRDRSIGIVKIRIPSGVSSVASVKPSDVAAVQGSICSGPKFYGSLSTTIRATSVNLAGVTCVRL